ncbi:Pinin/SDK/MemA protein [Penicillium robsamsonii]|uniref:Pinin/SDK/MemA protein n=1 Tax=Penicillium robsamsonii TaxID=1792511 RepID=UPI0025495242|nr:Pinin/SDK/MemA protein [Penicillium robsamsonii]KAJ5813001.1 Pinin/SDK/MemA protein [Penicillium robsamsonii]
MSEGPETLASAVAVPSQDLTHESPELTAKRRKSSVSEYDTKRRRLSSTDNNSPQSQRRRPSSPPPTTDEPVETKPTRPRGGRDEDRKRGQRLFGGLLGTLSQSSSSAAQRRRADIEKKQQEKLKSLDAEYGELKKRRKEQRDEIRRREMPLYEREAMQTRHSNMLAMAHFHKTQTKPALYYKPWQPRPGDESAIKQQIEEAEATVAREVAEFEARYPPEAFAPEQPIQAETQQTEPTQAETKQAGEEQLQKPEEQQTDGRQDQPAPEHEADLTDAKSKETAQGASDTVGVDNNEQAPDLAKTDETTANVEESAVQDQHDAHRDDDGDEVVEDNEDTVIY